MPKYTGNGNPAHYILCQTCNRLIDLLLDNKVYIYMIGSVRAYSWHMTHHHKVTTDKEVIQLWWKNAN